MANEDNVTRKKWNAGKTGATIFIILHLLTVWAYYQSFKWNDDGLLGVLVFYFPVSLPVIALRSGHWLAAFWTLFVIGGLWYGLIGYIIGSIIGCIGSFFCKKPEPDNSKQEPEPISNTISYEQMINDTRKQIEVIKNYLKQAEHISKSGNYEHAAELLEQALKVSSSPLWKRKISGIPREQFSFNQIFPVSGYALLVDLSSKAGKKDLALVYFKRMLELNPEQKDKAIQAAKLSKITKKAKLVAKEMGIPFSWYDGFF